MKTPDTLRQQLRRQWHNNKQRAERLLGRVAWPLSLSIGLPTSQQVLKEATIVQAHIQNWRAVEQGTIEWAEKSYRGLAAPIRIPVRWLLNKPSEWVAACRDAQITSEFTALEQLVGACSNEAMGELLIRERSLWRDKPLNEVQKAIELADHLEPDCASGQPLRLLAGHGVDTKFFERHNNLLCRLLDTRFTGAASEQGLVRFLGAQEEKDHWLLIKPLSEGVLPFSRLRLTDSELMHTSLSASRLLLVENERCEYLLPQLDDCIAILGAGGNLAWLAGKALDGKQLYYWGDLDTWGLTLLGRARELRPELQAVLMTQEVFDCYREYAVPEQHKAAEQPHGALTPQEKSLYEFLWQAELGRLEQEYIPLQLVQQAITSELSCEGGVGVPST